MPITPEADRDRPTGSQHAMGLGECLFAATPDSVDRGDGIEGLIGPWEREHVPHPKVGVRCPRSGDVDEWASGIDTGCPGSGGICLADSQARPTGDVEQRRARPDAQVCEGRQDHVGGVVLEEARPIARPAPPGIPGLVPLVALRGLAGRMSLDRGARGVQRVRLLVRVHGSHRPHSRVRSLGGTLDIDLHNSSMGSPSLRPRSSVKVGLVNNEPAQRAPNTGEQQ